MKSDGSAPLDGFMGKEWICRKAFGQQYIRKGKKYKAAYLDSMDLLYGDVQDEKKDEVRDRAEHRGAVLPGREGQDYQGNK